MGARPMGMGNAFVAVADDGSAIFTNPAGLAGVKKWGLLSAYSSFLNEVQYLSLSYSTPFRFRDHDWGVGLGYVGAGIPNNPIQTQQGPSYFDYYNNVYILALSLKVNEALSLGAGFRNFRQGFSGGVVAAGTGQDLDVGLKYILSDWSALGLNCQNILPYSWGGKIVWDGGHAESIPALLKIGGSFKLADNRLLTAVDYDVWPTRQASATLHAGAEWALNPFLVVRGGLDQSFSTTGLGLTTNPTFGLGLKLWNMQFDYAYHPYYEEQANLTQFFSLAFSPALQPAVAPPAKGGPDVFMPQLQDKMVVHDEKMTVNGRVNSYKITTLEVNGTSVPVGADGTFTAAVKFDPGKNTVWVVGLDDRGRKFIAQRVRVLRLAGYPDVPANLWAREAIEEVGMIGLLPGFADGQFKPELNVKRIDLLTAILKAGSVPLAAAVTALPFKDVKPDDRIAPYVRAAYDAGLIKVGADRRLLPYQFIDRLESVVLLARGAKLNLTGVQEKPFADISGRLWAAQEVTAAKQAGLLDFIKGNFLPGQKLTRAELAYMFSRTPLIAPRIKDLLDFETGYQAESN